MHSLVRNYGTRRRAVRSGRKCFRAKYGRRRCSAVCKPLQALLFLFDIYVQLCIVSTSPDVWLLLKKVKYLYNAIIYIDVDLKF